MYEKGLIYLGIIERYHDKIFEMYMSTHPGANPQSVRRLIHQFTNDNVRNIPCQMHNNVSRENLDSSIIDVFDWVDNRKPIITGNGSFFKQHSEYIGAAIKMLEKLMANRDRIKRKMYTFKEDSIEYKNASVAQLSIKVIMNADYGGCGTIHSPFFSQYIPPATTGTAKNLTTTLICCLELLCGNHDKYVNLNNINELFDMISVVINDERSIIVDDNYSIDEVLQHLVSMTNNLTSQCIKTLRLYLSTLDNHCLTKLMLVNNIRLVLSKYLASTISRISEYVKSNKLDINNMTEDSIRRAGFGKKVNDEIKEDIDYVSQFILTHCVYPYIPNDVEIRADNMERIIVCVTDTDSLMIHFSHFLDLFQVRVSNFRDSCLMASAIGMRLFIENIIPKYVEYYAVLSGIEDKYYRDKLVFKNEFAFLSMTLLAKKMYTASTFVQEGNPRNIHNISVTGLSFKKRDSAEFLEPVMERLYDKYILTSDNIDVESILDEFYELRNDLISKIRTHTEFYKVLSIKGIDAYDASRVLPEQMRGAIVWNNIVPDEEILPMDRVIVIPLSFDLLNKYQHIGNIGEILRLSSIESTNYDKNGKLVKKKPPNPVICLPEHYKTIPDWVQPVIDVEFAVDKLLTPFKQLFALFDVNMPKTRGGVIPSRMICL